MTITITELVQQTGSSLSRYIILCPPCLEDNEFFLFEKRFFNHILRDRFYFQKYYCILKVLQILYFSFYIFRLFSEKSKDVFIIIAKFKLIYHDVQTENPASENLNAICFWGSLFLDGLSVIKEFDRLRSFECRKVCLMGMLKNHLTCEMLALKEIVMKS